MSDLHSQTLAPTASLVVTVATHVDTEQRCGGWSLQALQTNSVAQHCWRVPVTGQANPRVGLLGLPKLAGGIPPAAGHHWGRRCCNLRKALQPDLPCRVMCNRGYIFTLFTKSQFTPTQVPLQVDSATTPDLILFFLGGGGGGGGVPKHPCILKQYLQYVCQAYLNNVAWLLQFILLGGYPFISFSFDGVANLGYWLH